MIAEREILIIDDHALVRATLVGIVKEIFSNIKIHEAGDSSEAMLMASRNRNISAILLDLDIPGMGGKALMPRLLEILPVAKIVVITGVDMTQDIFDMLDYGVIGIIPKTSAIHVIRDNLAMYLIEDLPMGAYAELTQDSLLREKILTERKLDEIRRSMTDRQKEILELLAEGRSNKEISHEVHLAEGTVKNHISTILNALGADNRTQAVVLAKRHKLI